MRPAARPLPATSQTDLQEGHFFLFLRKVDTRHGRQKECPHGVVIGSHKSAKQIAHSTNCTRTTAVIHTLTHTTHRHIHTYTHTYIHTYIIHTYVHECCRCVWGGGAGGVCGRVWVVACGCVYTHKHMHVIQYTYIHTYTHTYRHIYIYTYIRYKYIHTRGRVSPAPSNLTTPKPRNRETAYTHT